jgi:hypothetical protein
MMTRARIPVILLLPLALSVFLFTGGRHTTDVGYRVLEGGGYVFFRSDGPTLRVFVEEEDFTSFYRSIHRAKVPSPAPPYVDFSRDVALFISAGEKSTAGYSIELTGMRMRGETLEVRVLLIEPAEGSFQAQVVTHPYLIAATSRGSYTRIDLVNDRGDLLDRVPVPGPR